MSTKPKWLQHLAEFLIDNLTILLTIGFAGYIIYRREIAQVVVSTDELLTAVLGVLGLLATSEIIERYRRLSSIERSVGRMLSLMESRFTDRPSAIGFFGKLPDIDAYVQSANQIDLCGATLTSTINKQFSNLRERLRHGAQVRVLIIDPDSVALQMSAQRSGTRNDVDYFRTRLEATFRDLDYLVAQSSAPRPGQEDVVQGGSLAVRLLSYAPSFGLISLDAGRSNGISFVEIYPHKVIQEQPSFDLTPQRDGQWYTFFVQQFEEMWDGGRLWVPGRASNMRGSAEETPES